MSFLANLVRRSAGLAPAIISRPLEPAANIDIAAPEAEADAPQYSNPAPAPAPMTIPPATPVAAASEPAVDSAPPASVVPPITATPMPVVQRSAMAAAPPLPAIAAPPLSTESTLPVPGMHGEAISSTAPETPATRAPLAMRAAEREPRLIVTDAVSSPAPRDTEARPQPPVAAESPRIVEHVVAAARVVETPGEDRGHIKMTPAVAPLAAVAAPPAAEEIAVPERIVHVRIGAIEIHGSAAPPSAPAVVPAPPPSLPAADSGFDRYARLRSYSAWQV